LPEIQHSDLGCLLNAQSYTTLLSEKNVHINMAIVGKAEDNGYAEQLMRTINDEEVDLTEYEDFSGAYTQIGYFIEQGYELNCIHSSLRYLTLDEFETAWWEKQPSLP